LNLDLVTEKDANDNSHSKLRSPAVAEIEVTPLERVTGDQTTLESKIEDRKIEEKTPPKQPIQAGDKPSKGILNTIKNIFKF
jgi:hypothetical protein